MNFNKSTIQIGSTSADVFVSETNDYFYSLTSTAALIGKEPLSAFQFLKSKAFKSIHRESFQPFNFKLENITFEILPDLKDR